MSGPTVMRHLDSCLRVLASIVALSAASGCVVIPIGDFFKGPPLTEQVLVDGRGDAKIAVIDVSGVISADESLSLISSRPNNVSEIKARLESSSKDSAVKAIVLRISSPGGEVTACDVIHHEVESLRERTRLPVVASIQGMGASGGYYIACAADEIWAHPTSVVGSIGVILQSFDISALMAKIGIRSDPVKSAEKKDISSPFRARSDEETAILQKVVDDLYARFVEIVERSRDGLGADQVRRIADGRVVSGSEAKEIGLVDEVGYLEDAIARAAELAGVEKPAVVRYTRRAQGAANIHTLHGGGPHLDDDSNELRLRWSPGEFSGARFYYLWTP